MELIVKLEHKEQALWSLHKIAKQIMEGYTTGECEGATWRLEV